MSLSISTIKTCKFLSRYFCHGFTSGSSASPAAQDYSLDEEMFLMFAEVLYRYLKSQHCHLHFCHLRTRHRFLSTLVVGRQTFHFGLNLVSAAFCTAACSLCLWEQGEVQQTARLQQALEMLIRIDLDGDIKKTGVIAVTVLSVGLIQGIININGGCPSEMARHWQSHDYPLGASAQPVQVISSDTHTNTHTYRHTKHCATGKPNWKHKQRWWCV